MKSSVFSFLFCAISLTSPVVRAETTFDTSEKYAWSANTGWISFRHDRPASPEGVIFGGAFLSGYAYSPNLGWIHFGSGDPGLGYAYSNLGNDHGVNHDGTGRLSGYAWSANAGWVNFGWAAPNNPNRPRVNLLTGEFSGFAWGANIGWINLGTGFLTTQSMSDTDSDGDGIPDWWEMTHFSDLKTANAITDTDGDGVPDSVEFLAGTDPSNPASYFRIVAHSHELGITETTLEFTTSPSRLYRIEFSNDLGTSDLWTDSALGVFAPDPGFTTIRSVVYTGNPRKFFRVVSLVPLQP